MPNYNCNYTQPKEGYTIDEIKATLNFNKNLLESKYDISDTFDTIQYIITLAAVILNTFPVVNKNDRSRYFTNQLNVKKINDLLGSIVTVRHALVHPTDCNKVLFAFKALSVRTEDPGKYLGLEDYPDIVNYCKKLLSVDLGQVAVFARNLFIKPVGEQIEFTEFVIHHGCCYDRHDNLVYNRSIIALGRKYAPDYTKSLPDDVFCSKMKKELDKLKEGKTLTIVTAKTVKARDSAGVKISNDYNCKFVTMSDYTEIPNWPDKVWSALYCAYTILEQDSAVVVSIPFDVILEDYSRWVRMRNKLDKANNHYKLEIIIADNEIDTTKIDAIFSVSHI